MTCDCYHFERHGFPCRHMYMVLREVQTTDFDIRWHERYYWDYGRKSCEEYTRDVDAIRELGHGSACCLLVVIVYRIH